MIGERIKEARMALGYSAEQVAAFLGVSPATVYRYENGDISKLPSKFIKPLAEYLCVSPSWLMGWSNDKRGMYMDLHLFGKDDPNEQKLIDTYRSLSDDGKKYLLQQCDMALNSYKKDDSSISKIV